MKISEIKIMVTLLCWFFFTTTVTGFENIAKGKYATQSSTVGDAVASRAVDGNTNPYLAGGSCSSASETRDGKFWWRVDLGYNYYINRIRVTTSKDGPPLPKLYITVLTIDKKYEVFYTKPGNLSVGEVVDVVKETLTQARFVYIAHAVTDGPVNLTLCEVEIFGSVERHLHLDSKRGASKELLRHSSRSIIECGAFCIAKQICRSFLWQHSTKECILYSDFPTTTSAADKFVGFVMG